MHLDVFSLSIAGRRANNEDHACAEERAGLFVVADGMGGYEGGEVASAIAIEAIRTQIVPASLGRDVTWPYPVDPGRSFAENEILVATRIANEQIGHRRRGRLAEMGSTVVVLRLLDAPSAPSAIVAHVGDSRLYRLRGGRLAQLTTDHSLLAELIASGHQPDAGFAWRHVVTRALGTHAAEPDVHTVRVEIGDTFLLCTDGLSEVLADDEIGARLASPARRACEELVAAAYDAGSRDNITAIVIRVMG